YHFISATSASLSFFFSPYYFHNISLHSFPTRRSSDLNIYECKIDSVPRCQRKSPFCTISSISFLGQGTGFVCNRRIEKNEARRTDRKSTRLNSSHVSISYAVFCLKKKI